ncbi:hypothetical protein FEF10_08080 [Pseudomonas protegens]|uniref:Uncharacterized protein n=1 Tax=Pseudomonas protegens TaxID=380021 RepID=A0ABY2VQT8_9PSED|nr:hypothetical protein C1883_09160 [Pseudomonas protegens]TMM67391.1 hypothetical protein FEF10_08080 [Pseudomonas protegens]
MQKDRENTTRRRSRLAGEEALEPSSALVDAFAGKPAPTTLWLAVWDSVGAGLPAKRPSSLAALLWTPSLASQLLQRRGALQAALAANFS